MILPILHWFMHCAIASPFQKSSQADRYKVTPETQVTIALTEVDISGANSDKSTFWDRVTSVRSSLESNEGFLGGAIRREILGSRAWTMTVWLDENALEKFVYSKEHERAMKEGAAAVRKSKFFRGKRKWKELPLSWELAEKLIEEEGRSE